MYLHICLYDLSYSQYLSVCNNTVCTWQSAVKFCKNYDAVNVNVLIVRSLEKSGVNCYSVTTGLPDSSWLLLLLVYIQCYHLGYLHPNIHRWCSSYVSIYKPRIGAFNMDLPGIFYSLYLYMCVQGTSAPLKSVYIMFWTLHDTIYISWIMHYTFMTHWIMHYSS